MVADAGDLSPSVVDALSWEELGSEPTGITNLARLNSRADGKNTVFARIKIGANGAQKKLFQFGYSDRATVYVNGKAIYRGNNGYMSRDYRYLGTIGLFDTVYLDLKDGANDVRVVVAESFGGWGIVARLAGEGRITVE